MRFLVALIFGLATTLAHAHESRPVYLEIKEIQPETYQVLWKIPAGGIMKGQLYPVFPKACQTKFTGGENYSHALVRKQIMTCDGGLSGKKISVHGLDINIGISALVRIFSF